MAVFRLKVMSVAERKYFDFLKSNEQAVAPQPKLRLVNRTGILFMYVCMFMDIYIYTPARLPFFWFLFRFRQCLTSHDIDDMFIDPI
jgi:hypothetical protein